MRFLVVEGTCSLRKNVTRSKRKFLSYKVFASRAFVGSTVALYQMFYFPDGIALIKSNYLLKYGKDHTVTVIFNFDHITL